jgi:hypothetical protein
MRTIRFQARTTRAGWATAAATIAVILAILLVLTTPTRGGGVLPRVPAAHPTAAPSICLEQHRAGPCS